MPSLHTGANLQLKSPGRPPLLRGAEATLDTFEEQIRSLRAAGFSLSLGTLRSLLISLLLRDEHHDLISDHIHKDVPADFVPNRKKFFASDYWMLSFLHNRMGYSYRHATSAAQKLPSNHSQLVDDALCRLSIRMDRFKIPPERVFMMDETFVFYTPFSNCFLTAFCYSATCVRSEELSCSESGIQ